MRTSMIVRELLGLSDRRIPTPSALRYLKHNYRWRMKLSLKLRRESVTLITRICGRLMVRLEEGIAG